MTALWVLVLLACPRPAEQLSEDTGCLGPTWYADLDGDGYGDPQTAYESCAPHGGAVEFGRDCNDHDSGVNPGAEEACDGVDQDCDGEVDEGLPTDPWYADADGDGYGDPKDVVEACGPVDGRVEQGGDCDDAEPRVHPGALEIECAGIDVDCDGELSLAVIGPHDDVTHFASVEEAAAAAGPTDEVRVCPGTHPVEITVPTGAALSLRGTTGDPSDVVLDGEGLRSLFVVEKGALLSLEGLTLTGGWADGSGGGAVRVTDGALRVDDCAFRDHAASLAGGALSVVADAGAVTLEVTQSHFADCTAERGGAIHVTGTGASTVNISGVFEDVSATSRGGAVDLVGIQGMFVADLDGEFARCTAGEDGGAIAVDGGAGGFVSVLYGLSFEACEAGGSGGAVALDLRDGGGVALSADFADNVAGGDGGDVWVALGFGDLMFSECTFYGSQAGANGGCLAITLGAGGASVTDSTFDSCAAGENGGAIALGGEGASLGLSGSSLDGNWAATSGGAIAAVGSGDWTVRIRDTAISSSTAPEGAGIAADNADGTTAITVWESEVLGGDADEGGGAWVGAGATLTSIDADWGEDTTDNSPDDVASDAGSWSDYGSGASFTCTAEGCE